MNKKHIQNSSLWSIFCLFLLVGMISSCTKYPDPPQVFETPDTLSYTKERKVLVIVLDGASGPEIKQIMPTNIASLLPHAKYAWGAYGDFSSADGPSWINIVTGRSSTALGVVDSTFAPPTPGDDDIEDVEFPVVTNLFQRMLEAGRRDTTVVVSSWDGLLTNAMKYAQLRVKATNDAAVKDSAIKYLSSTNMALGIVHFDGINLAGITSGFSATIPAYKNAVTAVDGYIGNILTAVKNRPTYNHEDWLIIVTSSHGSTQTGYGGNTLDERRIFTIYYNDRLKQEEFAAPSVTYSTLLSGKSNNLPTLAAANAGSLYDFGASGEFTVICKVKLASKPSGSSHTVLFSRSSHAYSNVRGYNFMITGGGNYRYVMGDGTGGNSPRIFVGGGAAELSGPLNTWETVALRIYNEGGTRWAVMYTNGVKGAPADMGTWNTTGTQYPLIMGNGTAALASLGTNNLYISQLAYWNIALPESYIINYACMNGIPDNDPYRANLTGYWPMNEPEGFTFENKSAIGAGKDLVMPVAKNWLFGDFPLCGTATGSVQLLTNSEIVPQIFYWLKIKVSSTWNLASASWLGKYETEFLQ
jgi:hypothetical protein